ncbi:MAG: monovalent cation/H(+) antiporter subunit G [Candidatus Omnitrophota bacterium]|nr:monovalent cation/H(+) antiporter subunit G [Candidatus Omnitrophota bacterium]MBU1929281.1 monovalent cation/H(+) antiporter subunit G [Candidatus Omnitrophota bacterium]MBU2035569.1 monovalent cation/H(+) antiporter subunit G [Candidatus Omnitrophota bacterium]MBU2221481.1 monovalent cation/H(+) antiporter subunit G [Candidatus Omnitrophota bacterium]
MNNFPLTDIAGLREFIGIIFIIVGLGFDIFGCLGLLRLPDVYNRLQATTKCVTLGTCSILIGTLIFKGFSPTGIKAIMAAVFLLLTSPVAAHALARGAHKSGVKLWEKSVCDQYDEDKSSR